MANRLENAELSVLCGFMEESVLLRESLFNLTRGMKILRVGSKKIVGLGGRASKICILQNQQEEGVS